MPEWGGDRGNQSKTNCICGLGEKQFRRGRQRLIKQSTRWGRGKLGENNHKATHKVHTKLYQKLEIEEDGTQLFKFVNEVENKRLGTYMIHLG